MKFRHQEITDSGEGIIEFQKLSTYQLLPRRMFERNRTNPRMKHCVHNLKLV